MPNPRKGESEKDYVNRCIPIVLDEGTAKDGAQAAAICHSMYGESKKADEEGAFLTSDDLLRKGKAQLARMKVEKAGYYGGRAGDMPDRHLSGDGTFVGGFDGCVEHMIQCEGYEESYAEDICLYLKPEGGLGLPKGPEQPEFGTPQRSSFFSTKAFDEIGTVEKVTYEPPDAGEGAPAGLKKILRDVYQSCREQNPGENQTDKTKCSKIAWAAVGEKYEKNDADKWVLKESAKEVSEKDMQDMMDEYGDFDGDFEKCVEMLMDDGYSEGRAETICENLTSKSEKSSGVKRNKPSRSKFTGTMTRSGMQSGVIAGRYEEPEKVEVIPKVNRMDDELSTIKVPEQLMGRERFDARNDEAIPKATDKKKAPDGLEDVELPENLKAHPYGEVEDEIKVKQP